MFVIRLVKVSLLSAAISLGASAFAAYDQTWYQASFWSGEYPNGFSVIADGVSVPARADMDLDLPNSIACALPKKAVYHTWNTARPANYRTASKIFSMIANEDLVIGYTETTEVKAGESIEYLIYGAEGMFYVRFNGIIYEADQELLEKVTYDEKAFETPQDEWLNVTCMGGENAWIFMRDLMSVDQSGNVNWLPGLDSWFLGFREYGVVTDLSDEELGN